MLTKSLHTITAATNVARYILRRDARGYYTHADSLAADALAVLGHALPGNVIGSREAADPTIAAIQKNCAKVLAESFATTPGARAQSAVATGDRTALLQRQAG